MRYVLSFLLSVLLLSCSDAGQVVETDAADTGGPRDSVVDIVDASGGGDLATDNWVFELLEVTGFDSTMDTGAACQPGEGCFQDPCNQNSDCLSGYCVDYIGAQVCTTNCQDECPVGWECNPLAGTEPDLIYVCVSPFANLCKPCATGADCKSAGGVDNLCIDYGDQGSFCGGSCSDDEPCPLGFTCQEAATVDGLTSMECVNDAGVCPCTKHSIELQLWTPCEKTNELGVCDGKRVCVDGGLAACDAPEPAEEICDGDDNDCDGDVDEGTCDDKNPCTEDTCAGADGCEYKLLNGVECMDGNPCTAADHCVEGTCVGTPVVCDDDNPCTDDQCDGAGGCLFTPNTDDCDDGDPCTVGDTCKNAKCKGVDVACDCKETADCGALEDGNLCNGTLFCNQTKLPYQCDVNPASVVVCPSPTGLDAPCLQSVCDGATGECSVAAANDGGPCDDGNPCTLVDKCAEGVCAGQGEVNCNDGNLCTDDFCDPEGGCLHQNNQVPCQDGNACTLGDTCGEGSCQPGQSKSCDDGNVCTDDSCDPGTGCVHTANEAACDDANECTTADHCVNGFCVGTGSLECDDENACTKDICLPEGGCSHVALDGTACSDFDACTYGDVCDQGTCQPGMLLNCNDSNACTQDACVKGVCTHVDLEGECDDGNACTANSFCIDGACVPGDLVECDDGNVCTTDFCHPTAGCQVKKNTNPCDDANACTTNDVCEDGACVGGLALVCNDGNVCTDDSCVPDVGCQYVANEAECNDGNACTLDDVCSQGVCLGPGVLSCGDGLACTEDWCDPQLGCIHDVVIPCCGNGLLEEPEECDDGNYANDEVCLASCELPDCEDGFLFGSETDVDCGGDCPKCADGLACLEGADCESGYCEGLICQTPACDDEVKNGDETDVDCGADCPPCQAGQACLVDSDCVSGALCEENVCSLYGNGQDGAIDAGSGTITINTVASPASGTAGELTLAVDAAVTFQAGRKVLIHQSTGPDAGWWEQRRVASQDGGTLTLTSALDHTYVNSGTSHAQAVVVPEYTNVTISAQTLTAPAWNGTTGGLLAFDASGEVVMGGGLIDMTSRGFRGMQHGCSYRCQDGWSGESYAGPMGTGTAPAANGTGGGGGQRGQDCAAGGGGGYGSTGGAGTNGTKGSCHIGNHLGGTGGALGGVEDTASRILFGGAGGEGGGDEDGGYPGKGGNGGGAILFKAPQITITGGNVRVNGQTGNHGYQGCGSGGGMGGGGGGAAGGIWIGGETLALGAGNITAQGAPGGKCAPSNSSYPGGTGGNGRIAVSGADVSGTTTPAWTISGE